MDVDEVVTVSRVVIAVTAGAVAGFIAGVVFCAWRVGRNWGA